MRKQKTLRTLLTALLVVVIMVMSVPVFAITPTDSITLNGIESNAKITVYKLANFNYDEVAGQPVYPTYNWVKEVNEWLEKHDTYNKYVNGEGIEEFAKADNVQAVYGAITAAIKDKTLAVDAIDVTASTVREGEKAVINNLEIGTYLILVENVNAIYQPVVRNVGMKVEDGKWVTDSEPVEATLKRTEPSINKTVDSTDHYTSETIRYDIKVEVPTYPENSVSKKFVVSDKLPDALNIDINSIKVYGLTYTNVEEKTEATEELPADAYEKVTENATRKNKEGEESVTFAIDFDYEKIKQYSQIEITYGAILKADRDTSIYTEYKNEAYLDYTNNPYSDSDSDDNWTSKEDKETGVKTYGFNILKVANDENTALSGARFTITSEAGVAMKFVSQGNGIYYYDVNGSLTELEVASNGMLEVRGLVPGKYSVEETKAPDGYNKLQGKTDITVSKDGSVVTTKIVNKKGFQLPITGGLGTIVFTIAGAVLIIGGSATLIVINKKKKAKK